MPNRLEVVGDAIPTVTCEAHLLAFVREVHGDTAVLRLPLPGVGQTVTSQGDVAVVTVAGPDMTLEGYIEALTSALEQARKANKDLLDIKTAEKVWRQRAKAGA